MFEPRPVIDMQSARQLCTAAQMRVLERWARGWGLKRTAVDLGVTVSTVRTHLDAGRRRLRRAGAETPPGAQRIMRRCGRCGYAIEGPLEETGTAFATHPCNGLASRSRGWDD